jgi:hypothetical protein
MDLLDRVAEAAAPLGELGGGRAGGRLRLAGHR